VVRLAAVEGQVASLLYSAKDSVEAPLEHGLECERQLDAPPEVTQQRGSTRLGTAAMVIQPSMVGSASCLMESVPKESCLLVPHPLPHYSMAGW